MILPHAHGLVYGRRIRVLARHLAQLLPEDASVLDIGAGDGRLARMVMDLRPDLSLHGVDVMTRTVSHVPVEIFDGTRLPFGDRAFDAAMMVDVLHHAEHQYELLAEMARVVKRTFVIKDHVVRGALARPTLAFMDWVGNARYGVALPYAYWSDEQWSGAFGSLGFVARERRESLGLYAWPASLLFERGLHFVARFDRTA